MQHRGAMQVQWWKLGILPPQGNIMNPSWVLWLFLSCCLFNSHSLLSYRYTHSSLSLSCLNPSLVCYLFPSLKHSFPCNGRLIVYRIKITCCLMALTYLSCSLILSVVSSMCSISLALSKKFRRWEDALSSLLYRVYLDYMLLALSHHPSPRVSFVIYTRPFSLSPPIHALELHTIASIKFRNHQEVCSNIENDFAGDLGGEVAGQTEVRVIAYLYNIN